MDNDIIIYSQKMGYAPAKYDTYNTFNVTPQSALIRKGKPTFLITQILGNKSIYTNDQYIFFKHYGNPKEYIQFGEKYYNSDSATWIDFTYEENSSIYNISKSSKYGSAAKLISPKESGEYSRKLVLINFKNLMNYLDTNSKTLTYDVVKSYNMDYPSNPEVLKFDIDFSLIYGNLKFFYDEVRQIESGGSTQLTYFDSNGIAHKAGI